LVSVTSKKGDTFDLRVSFKAILALEDEMDASFFRIMQDIGGEETRLSMIDRMARIVEGYAETGWEGFIKDGLDLDSLMTVITKGMEELGFTSGASPAEQ